MGSLSNKNGKTPVASKDVQLNIWNTGYANPKNMYDLGYDLINTLEGSLYIVPSAGYYSDYLNSQNLYNNWVPNNFSGTVLRAGDKQVLGVLMQSGMTRSIHVETVSQNTMTLTASSSTAILK